jgi:hypothetical protein
MSILKGFMKLSKEELKLLESKISVIDVQKGCPHQCLTCGVNAPKYKGSMSWKDFKTISDSILEAKVIRNIDLCNNDRYDDIYGYMAPFWSSDPMFYRSMDGNTERTIYDIAMTFHTDHSKATLITTAGWNPESYIQKAAEKIVQAHQDPKFTVNLMYSVKTVNPAVMRDYDEYLKRSGANIGLLKDFIKDSSYVKRVTSNLMTLLPILTNPSYNKLNLSGLVYEPQYLDDKDILKDDFPDEYSKYMSLFSKYALYNICQDIRQKLGWRNNRERKFNGIGRAMEIGIKKSYGVLENEEVLNNECKSRPNQKFYYVMINGYGQLEIYYGVRNDLCKILVPKEHFQILSDKTVLPWKKKEYLLLANLQGRNLLE